MKSRTLLFYTSVKLFDPPSPKKMAYLRLCISGNTFPQSRSCLQALLKGV